MKGAVATHSGLGWHLKGFRHYLSLVCLVKEPLHLCLVASLCYSIYVNVHSLLVQLLITYNLLFCTNVHSAL